MNILYNWAVTVADIPQGTRTREEVASLIVVENPDGDGRRGSALSSGSVPVSLLFIIRVHHAAYIT